MNPGKSKAQAAALTRIKPYTDFNNLATQSRLGREGVERQIRAIYRRKNRKIGHAATSRSVGSLAPPGVRRRAHQKAGDYPGLFAS